MAGAAGHIRLLPATGESTKTSRNFAVNASIDQAAISLGMATFLGACLSLIHI